MRARFLVSLALVLITLAVFAQVVTHEFLYYDDNVYITENHRVQAGLTGENLLWAFSTLDATNWHPLTWLSFMLDIDLYGLNPHGHHLTNLLFHIANVLLLFLLLRRMTGALWESAAVAALFAIHPLHVESVAWVAERKDVLSTFFGLLTLRAYLHLVEHPGWKNQLSVVTLFALSLMAKPMLVTLPFLLLLLDYWPLKRFSWGDGSLSEERKAAVGLLREKLPLFALAAASSTITYLAQRGGGSVGTLERYPLGIRLENTLVAYVHYLQLMIWPQGLAIFYPYPGGALPLRQVAGSALILLLISWAAIRWGVARRYLAVGWLWYLGTLVPVIGLIQVGEQAMADRYTYFPLIGVFVMIAWGISELSEKWQGRRVLLGVASGLSLVILMLVAARQARYWHDDITLFQHTVEVTQNNFQIYNNLAKVLGHKGKFQEAATQFTNALLIKPDSALTHYNLGVALFRGGRPEEAARHYVQALSIQPGLEPAHYQLAVLLAAEGRYQEAIAHYTQALDLDPGHEEAHLNLALALAQAGKLPESVSHLNEAARLNPDDPMPHEVLGLVYYREGHLSEAILEYEAALKINPQLGEAKANLAQAYREKQAQAGQR